MIATNTSHSQRLLAECVFPDQDARDLPAAFDSVARVLSTSGALYAFVGRCGRARFCEAQWTGLVNVRIEAKGGSDQLARELQSAFKASCSATSSLRLELDFVDTETELFFIDAAQLVRWFDAEARMATAEHLLWLALSSKDLRSHVDAIDLIQSGHVELSTFDVLTRKEGPHFRRRLEAASAAAERGKDASFSRSMQKRNRTL